jgi:hypothetical protein
MNSGDIERARRADIKHTAQRLGVTFKHKPLARYEMAAACPLGCAKRDGFSVNTHKQVFICRPSMSGGDAIAMVQHVRQCSFIEAVAFINGETASPMERQARPSRTAKDEEIDPIKEAAKALAKWQRRQAVEGSVAERYLREARRYSGPIPATLGFLPASTEYPPTLIAAFGVAHEPECGAAAIADAEVKAVHLTRLLSDGSDRIGKIVVGRGALGAPIVLFPPNDLLGLAITEGIEDGLSVHAATGLGVWAAGAANRMPALAAAVPAYVECVTVFRDDDKAGRLYATDLAQRLVARGIEALLKPLATRAVNGQD